MTRIMRVFFILLYHQLAWGYDLVATIVSLGNWGKWRNSILRKISGPRVLELGYGPGHLQHQLAELNLDHFGIDESDQMGKITSRRLVKIGRNGRIARGYTQYLPFPDKIFDQVVSTFPSEYIFNPLTLSESYRILKDGGKFVILPVAWIDGKRWWEKAAAWLFKITGQAPTWDDRYLDPFHKAGFDIKTEIVEGPSWTVMLIIGEKPEVHLPLNKI